MNKDELAKAFDYALEVERELNNDKDSYKWEIKGPNGPIRSMGIDKKLYEDLRDFTISIPSTDKYRERTVSKYSVMYPGIGMSNKKRLKLNNY